MSETASSILSDRGRELFYKKAARTARPYLRQMRELGNMPVSLAPFMETLEKVFVKMESPFASEKTVGSFCAMVPNELIYAARAVPVRLCSGSYTAYSISDGLAAITPCPPLILTLGLCASLPLPAAGITGAVFAGASTIGPMFLLALLLGLLTKKIRKEIPSFLKWLRLASYIILAALPFLIFE